MQTKSKQCKSAIILQCYHPIYLTSVHIYTGLANRSAVVANSFAEILSGPCTLSVLCDFNFLNTCTSVKCRSVNSSCSHGTGKYFWLGSGMFDLSSDVNTETKYLLN